MSAAGKRSTKVVLTGATGYVGGRLLKDLESAGHRVRCLVRRPELLRGRADAGTEIVRSDLSDYTTLVEALRGAEAAYYLVHAMGAPVDFENEDRRLADVFSRAARAAGVGRLIYLGGICPAQGEKLSAHLRSRQEVGRLFHASGVPTLELRASIILGSGSLSFEIIRSLVERLPVMVTPRWVRVRAQPIFIDDVLAYLLQSLEVPLPASRVYEIGGAEVMSYGALMNEYARQRGLRRWMIPVPVLTPRLSGIWLNLVAPVYARVGRKLVESIRHATVVERADALRDFPVRPVGVREALARVLMGEERHFNATRWADAVSSQANERAWRDARWGVRIVDYRVTESGGSVENAFRHIERIGGKNGWYFWNFLWRWRGWLDALVGGVGLRRGRRDPHRLRVGDALDYWRVELIEPGRRLRLRAEMKLPGRAWLEFDVKPKAEGCEIHQTAIFDPLGLWGLVYWYALLPVHKWIFSGMLRAIARRAGETRRHAG
ncbi:MAG: SDR family oxidoreductase [Elusimicrobia bacterium]|nr:SDR family oxidoreductase [Elusimicrobiota bacterium]MBK7545330.1 SDR family oxidoreductase [Elusimicrobiota bacterium]MBK7575653.1 SDR family oxidoreductase [Elusimicrobiota bacterium]MBK7688559.1 SDR family oxidoreductase [Elusimicrobiota bacterium]MBK8127016.1 SDR family oxidoreductase [Elusimicrobiota bacterium]